MSEFRSAIETMMKRELRRENRIGIDHFVPGQIAARLIDPLEPEAAQLSFVTPIGDAVLVIAIKKDDRWHGVLAFKGGQLITREIDPPPLTNRMIDALEAAE